MISYEEALKKAKGLKESIDKCYEYDSAYMFASSEDKRSIGGDGPCVILKESGEAISRTHFFEFYDADEVREFDV
jgi:hypothetical protein